MYKNRLKEIDKLKIKIDNFNFISEMVFESQKEYLRILERLQY